MTQESKNIVYQHKLEVLQDQNSQLLRQIGFLKQSNEALMIGLTDVENIKQENYTLNLQNRQLNDMLESERKRCEQLQSRRYSETKELKEQLSEQLNYIQRMRIEHEKQLFRLNEQLKKSKNQIRQRRNQTMDQLTKSMAISSCLIDLKPNEENSMERSNNLNYSNNMNYTNFDRSTSKSPIHSRMTNTKPQENYSYLQKSTNNYAQYSKQEIKVALKALNKAGKNLRDGCSQVSILQQRKSFINKNMI